MVSRLLVQVRMRHFIYFENAVPGDGVRLGVGEDLFVEDRGTLQ